MANVNIKVNLITKAAEVQLAQFNAAIRGTKSELGGLTSATDFFGNSSSNSINKATLAFGKFGTVIRAGGAGAALFALIGTIQKSVTEFAEFETALVSVGKTSNLSGVALQQFGDQAQKLSQKLPIPVKEILNLSAAAAQLGVQGSNNLLKFAEVGARLGRSTNVGAEEAVTALSRLIGITKGSQEDIDRLGSSLVSLGNQFKATESEILNTADRVGRATAGFGLNAEQVLAISTALAEAGIEAESGGSSVGIFFTNLDKALTNGGERLEAFTKVLGVTGEQLRMQLQQQPEKVFADFIAGLKRSQEQGINLTGTLKSLGLDAIRTAQTFRPLVNISDKVAESFKVSSEEFKNNTSLFKESGAQFTTVNSALDQLANNFNNIFINLGKLNSGIIKSVIDSLSEAAKFVGTAFEQDSLQEAEQKLANAKAELALRTKILEIAEKQNSNSDFKAKALVLEIEALEKVKRLTKEIEEAEKANDPASSTTPTGTPSAGGNAGTNTETEEIIKRKQDENLKLQELQIQFDLAKEEAKLAADGRIDELDKLALLNLENNLRTSLENQRLALERNNQVKGQSTQKAQELELKNLAAQEKRKGDIQEAEAARQQQIQALTLNRTGQAFGALASLAKAGGEKYFKIAKALSVAQITIHGYESIQAAATLPYPANIPGIIAETARFAVNLAAVNSTTPAFEQGGIVGGSRFSGDNITARVNSGEMILNRQQQANLFQIANRGQDTSSGREIVVHTSVQLNEREIARAVSRQVADGAVLGELD